MIDIAPDVFWSLTPWQFKCCVDAHGKKTEYDHDHAAWIMWHNALLSGVSGKKFPPLKQFLSGARKVSKKIDERGIMHHLKEYQRRKDQRDDGSETIG